MFSQGFRIYDAVLSIDECDSLAAELSALAGLDRSRAGIRNLMSVESVRTLASDTRLLSICHENSGSRMTPFKATLFEKTGKANWLVVFHQDTALPVESVPRLDGWGPSSVKDGVMFSHAPTSALQEIVALRIHLDASTSENGPLRVITGSHRKRVLDDREFERIVRDMPVKECTVDKGGVIAMSPLVFHASSKVLNEMPRRVLHIEYAPSLDIEGGVRLAIA